MKKIVVVCLMLLLLVLGCQEKENKKVTKKPEKKEKVLADISLTLENISLPAYNDLKDVNFLENLTIIYADKDRGGYIISGALKSEFLRLYKAKVNIVKDVDVTKEILVSGNILLIGNTQKNRVIKEIAKHLPYYADGEKVVIGDKEYVGEKFGVTYVYPNLYNLNKKMILVMGNSENALKIIDFEKYDLNVIKGIREIMPVFFKEVAFAKFGNDWKIDNLKEVDPKLLDPGDNEILEVGEIIDYPYPEWARGELIYQIFVRSFHDSNGDGKGDLKGITQKLDYLKDLGVKMIWMTPIFESNTYHGYDVMDYFKINSDYGTIEDYNELCAEAHKRGMKIILDLVLNHTSKKNKYFQSAYKKPDSPHDRWFYFSNIANNIYADWYFRDNIVKREHVNSAMPAWNTNNPEVVDHHVEIAKHWMDPNKDGDFSDGADGFRLDYVKGPRHEYWKLLRQKIKAFNPNIFLMAETWMGYEEMAPFFDHEMDSCIDFHLYGTITSGSMREMKSMFEQEDKLDKTRTSLARFMSNHDVNRFPTYLRKPQVLVFSTMVYTLDGNPMLYYGDEIGMKGEAEDAGDLGRRRPMEWDTDNNDPGMTTWNEVYNPDPDGISVEEQIDDPESYLNHYKKLIKIRKENIDILADGQRILLPVYKVKDDGELKKSTAALCYLREKNGKYIFVALNFRKGGTYKVDFSDTGAIGKKFKEVYYGNKEIEIVENMFDLEVEEQKGYIFVE